VARQPHLTAASGNRDHNRFHTKTARHLIDCKHLVPERKENL
jgi:hypothetical protein